VFIVDVNPEEVLSTLEPVQFAISTRQQLEDLLAEHFCSALKACLDGVKISDLTPGRIRSTAVSEAFSISIDVRVTAQPAVKRRAK